MKAHYLLLYLGCLLNTLYCYPQRGTLDVSFGNQGIAIADIFNDTDEAKCIAVQDDGKIVVAGTAVNGSYLDFALVRFNIDGSLDNSFGNEGKVTTSIGSSDNRACAMAIQEDGKIVVCGSYTNGTGESEIAVVRYTASGYLDYTFNTTGKITTISGLTLAHLNSIAIQPDEKILVGGSGTNMQSPHSTDFLLIRLKADGSIDDGFGSNGIVFTPIIDGDDYISSLVLQPDGKIVVAGNFTDYPSPNFHIALARYNTNGSLDETFGSDGIVKTILSDECIDQAKSIVILKDNKILMGGNTTKNTGQNDFLLIQYNSDGSVDTEFGNNGMAITDINGGNDDGNSLAVTTDGKIIMAGKDIMTTQNIGVFALVGYNENGTIDTEFGTNGIVNEEFYIYGSGSCANSVVLQSDGSILVAGYSHLAQSTSRDMAVAKYLNSSVKINILVDKNQYTEQISPNPIHENTILEYSLKNEEFISIHLYDLNGKLLKSFVNNEKRLPGDNIEKLNFGNTVPAGIYLIELKKGKKSNIVKIMVH